MPTTNHRLIGINEVGHRTGGVTDNPWGATQQQGAVITLTTETADLLCGQAKVLESTFLVQASMGVQIALCQGELLQWQRAWGMPDAALTGNLPGTAETLTFTETNLGSQERALYIIGDGPFGDRRVDIPRARVSDLGNMVFASNEYQLPSATWQVLNPGGGADVMTITDAV